MQNKNPSILREQFPTFLYRGFEIIPERNRDTVRYFYTIEGLEDFTSEFHFPCVDSQKRIDQLIPMVTRLGLIEALSYWKATCSPQFQFVDVEISSDELTFWKHLFYHGLGEFRYQNGIQTLENEFISFCGSVDSPTHYSIPLATDGNLIPVGGGKDSLATLELLAHQKNENMLFFLNPRPACMRSASAAGYAKGDIFEVSRSLDRKLLALNSLGYLNGHTPFSALLAFVSLLAAALLGKKNVILSNERSASETNIADSEVNHQYSKSLEFESQFRSYSHIYLSQDIEYFSLLRPLHEVQIARYFANFTKYHSIVRSCNVGCYEDKWCEECPKCLFVALILSPFTSLQPIFRNNPLENQHLEEMLLDLCLPARIKPFECVGTREESTACVRELLQRNPVSKLLRDKNQICVEESTLKSLLYDWNERHFLPPEFEKCVKQKVLQQ